MHVLLRCRVSELMPEGLAIRAELHGGRRALERDVRADPLDGRAPVRDPPRPRPRHRRLVVHGRVPEEMPDRIDLAGMVCDVKRLVLKRVAPRPSLPVRVLGIEVGLEA